MDKVTQSPLARYREHLEKGELAYQFDRATGAAIFHPRVIAPKSGSPDLEWRVSAGLGTVYATTVNHLRDGAPYNVALIDLDEGFRMMSRVEEMEPSSVKIGMRVKLRIKAGGEGAAEPLPVFVPVEASR
ncbi:MAG: OB-fold domain-containing protein [Beijerinckiaceae bacterium]